MKLNRSKRQTRWRDGSSAGAHCLTRAFHGIGHQHFDRISGHQWVRVVERPAIVYSVPRDSAAGAFNPGRTYTANSFSGLG
jgi:hypothetical protein